MTATDASPLALRRYLLGALSDEAAAEIDVRVIGDPAFADDVADVEDALIDAHLDGRLPADEDTLFRQHYLASPRHQERLAFRRALRDRRPAATPARAPWWLAVAASIGVAAVAGWWLGRPHDQPLPQTAGAPVAPDTGNAPRPGDTNAAPRPDATSDPARPAAMVALTLAPVVTRGGGAMPTLRVPRGSLQVQLRLVGDLPDADSLIAELTPLDAPDGARRWPVDAAPPAPDGAGATVTLPVYAVPAGDYIITLWQGDAEAVQRYAFRIAP